MRELASRPGIKPHIVSGQDEARFSGYGVICGMPDASGVMGDLGGGSLELVARRAGQARQLQHAAGGPAAADVVGQGRSQEDRRRRHRGRALAARGDRQDLLCRGRRLAFVRPAAHGAGGLSAAHHPSLRHRGRGGARGRPPDRRAERQVAGEDARRVAPARRHPAARLPGARPAAGGAEAAQRGVLRLRPARGVLLFAPQRSRTRAPSA